MRCPTGGPSSRGQRTGKAATQDGLDWGSPPGPGAGTTWCQPGQGLSPQHPPPTPPSALTLGTAPGLLRGHHLPPSSLMSVSVSRPIGKRPSRTDGTHFPQFCHLQNRIPQRRRNGAPSPQEIAHPANRPFGFPISNVPHKKAPARSLPGACGRPHASRARRRSSRSLEAGRVCALMLAHVWGPE